MRILLAEDDESLGDAIVGHLRAAGNAVDWAQDGVTTEAALADDVFDVLVLDLGLPARDGLGILRRLRARSGDIPVLVITARDAVPDRVAGLESGADDYLVKPFALSELEARVRALVRRSAGRNFNLVRAGALEFDVRSREVRVRDTRLDLSAREAALLELLIDRPGRIVSKERIRERLCDFDSELSGNAIEVYVHRLRRKLAEHGMGIATVRGLGYWFDADRAH